MGAAAYTTDLILLDDCNTDTGYNEPTASGWTDFNAESFGETDLFIQGTTCISGTVKVGVGATLFDNATGITMPTDGAYLVWMLFGAPNSLDSEANGGIRTIIGATTADFNAWTHGGNDTYIYGGWANLATNPTVTADYTEGTPGTTYRHFGWCCKATAVPSKGNPYCVDAMRYGRCEARINGGDVSNGYATFAGFAIQNDSINNRWGLIQEIPGGFLWKGLITLGYTTAVDFRDSNTLILVDNTKKVTSGFNKIEVRQATSRVDWTSISFQALGTVSRGDFIATENADINIDGCSFTDMGTYTFLSNSTILTTIFRRCNLVTAGGATFTGCKFDSTNDAAKAMLAATTVEAAAVSDCEFISSGTKYGLEITGAAGDFTLTGVTWTGYASSNGTTGNEAIHITATTGTFNITISGGTTPSIHTAGAIVNIIAGAVTTQITAKDADTKAAIENMMIVVKAADIGPLPFEASVTITRVGDVATVAHTGHGLSTNQKVEIEGAAQNEYNRIKTITKIDADSYSYAVTGSPTTPATGTIISTAIVIAGLTNASGQISDTRVIASDQDFTGKASKGSHSPVYISQDLSGTIDSNDGKDISLLMIPDD